MSAGVPSSPHSGLCAATRKRCFATRAAAASVRFDGMRPYRCTACGFWHLGHRNPRIVSGEVLANREWSDRSAGVVDYAVRVCPGCRGEGTVAVFLHTHDCPRRDDDVSRFPRRQSGRAS